MEEKIRNEKVGSMVDLVLQIDLISSFSFCMPAPTPFFPWFWIERNVAAWCIWQVGSLRDFAVGIIWPIDFCWKSHVHTFNLVIAIVCRITNDIVKNSGYGWLFWMLIKSPIAIVSTKWIKFICLKGFNISDF